MIVLELKKENHILNPKYPTIFFSVGVIMILMLFLVGIPMMTLPDLQQDNDNGTDQLLAEENVTTKIDLKSIERMSCTELNQFITSFEKGWGSAIPLYNEKCL